MKLSEVIVNQQTALHPTQTSATKVYLKDFAQYLQSMLDDSGHKFSEEYEVKLPSTTHNGITFHFM